MADSPVESSGIQFCVSIWLTVQWSPVESSFVSVYGWQSSGVQCNPVLYQYMVGSPVESSRVQFCIDSPVESSGIHFCIRIWLAVQWSPVESSFVLDRFDSPVESSFVNMVQYIVKSSEVQWNPVESTGVHVDCIEKTSAHRKGEACDVWTEQVHEPHLNNTHTHTHTHTHSLSLSLSL